MEIKVRKQAKQATQQGLQVSIEGNVCVYLCVYTNCDVCRS